LVNATGSPVALGPAAATTAAFLAMAPPLEAASTKGLASDAAIRALLLDGSTVTGKPRPLFEP
jgi:hypothetical protein